MSVHNLDQEVVDAIRGIAAPGEGVNRTLRRLLKLEIKPMLRGRRPRFANSEWGTHTYLEALTIGQSVTLEWKYEQGKEAAGAVNAQALRMAVARAKKKSGHKLKTAASINGLIVTRVA